MKIAFLTAGGIAPCLSASIGSLIDAYNDIYPKAELIGYLHGYRGLLLGNSIAIPEKVKNNTDILYNFGGSPIGNSRVKLTNIESCVNSGYIKDGENPLEIAASQLIKDDVNILHTIGGDDTNTMAAELSYHLREKNYDLTVVGLPKTVDNDIYPITQTLGAWTAAEQGAIFFENIANENTTSNRQLIIHEVMGRHCGWLTAYTAKEYHERLDQKEFLPEILIEKKRWDIDAIYIPEIKIDFDKECSRLRKLMDEKDSVNIFLSEGAGTDTIVSEIENNGGSVTRDAFGHVA
ncbi:MAG: pyrophosphate--fructose-6-phosphate 1-phosphotransferase, partial [Candidatus Marinimicrobia bacterium]|nr:pyrophosphate--fructose-6-phosphate 1-phosphotransferase [Candidatus Neomarinimicrobiota bacterium]